MTLNLIQGVGIITNVTKLSVDILRGFEKGPPQGPPPPPPPKKISPNVSRFSVEYRHPERNT